MPKQTLTIRTTHQVVEIEGKWGWRNIVVRLDDHDIGHFPNLKELKKGTFLKTPIGDLFIQYKNVFGVNSGFSVWYNNTMLDGSIDDPVRKWRVGYQVTIGLGLFNIAVGVLSLAIKSPFLSAMGVTPLAGVFGVVVLLLGLWARQGRSGIALGIAAFIFGADGVLGILAYMGAGMSPNFGGLFVRAYFVYLMAQGANVAAEVLPEYSEKAKNG